MKSIIIQSYLKIIIIIFFNCSTLYSQPVDILKKENIKKIIYDDTTISKIIFNFNELYNDNYVVYFNISEIIDAGYFTYNIYDKFQIRNNSREILDEYNIKNLHINNLYINNDFLYFYTYLPDTAHYVYDLSEKKLNKYLDTIYENPFVIGSSDNYLFLKQVYKHNIIKINHDVKIYEEVSDSIDFENIKYYDSDIIVVCKEDALTATCTIKNRLNEAIDSIKADLVRLQFTENKIYIKAIKEDTLNDIYIQYYSIDKKTKQIGLILDKYQNINSIYFGIGETFVYNDELIVFNFPVPISSPLIYDEGDYHLAVYNIKTKGFLPIQEAEIIK